MFGTNRKGIQKSWRELHHVELYTAEMSSPEPDNHIGEIRESRFATTSWSIVLAAGQCASRESRLALETLCETYWLPVYAYARRLAGSIDEAEDLTQGFFVHLLEKDAIAKATKDRGRFRAFLLTAMKNFVANDRDKFRAEKRGGGRHVLSLDFAAGESRCQIEPSIQVTPETLFERRWVLTLLDQVLDRLRMELAETGKEALFANLKGALLGEMTQPDYELAAAALGIPTAAASQAAYRMRKRYRELFRQEVARTVENDADIDDEIGQLLEMLGR